MHSHVLHRRAVLALLAVAATGAGAAPRRKDAPAPLDAKAAVERLNAAAERPLLASGAHGPAVARAIVSAGSRS